MKIKSTLACLSLLSIVAACAPSGYYDSNGQYRSYGASDTYRNNHPMAGTAAESEYDEEHYPATNTTVIYTRPGYYDRNGYYIARDSGPHLSNDLLPPHGMCRVWCTDRPTSEEPPVESCVGIQNRVPVGAYVIYGG